MEGLNPIFITPLHVEYFQQIFVRGFTQALDISGGGKIEVFQEFVFVICQQLQGVLVADVADLLQSPVNIRQLLAA